MPAYVVALVLLSAWMHAGWNVLIKRSNDGQLDTVSLALAGSAIAALALPFITSPKVSSAPWMAASLIVHVAYYATLIEAYRHADLSVTYPLMRGAAPVFLTLLAPLAGEVLVTQQVVGIIVIGLGIVVPALAGLNDEWKSRKGLYFGLLNAVIIAMYTLLDGVGVRMAGTTFGYTLWLFFLNGWGILIFTVWKRGRLAVWHNMKSRWELAVTGALLSMGSYGVILWAMTISPIPTVAALREVSVVFAAIMGVLWLKEPMGKARFVGACLVALGACLLRFP